MPPQTPFPLNHALEEADAAIANTAAHKPTRAEARLNRLGDGVSSAADGYTSVAQSDAVASAFSLIKEEVMNFAENSKILISALDEVANLHPLIHLAVSLFKAALNLELTRRQNDDKVLALNATMSDMMSILKLLHPLVSAKEAHSRDNPLPMGDRLMQRMGAVIESIKMCAKTCDSYHKRNLTIKIFTSAKWKTKFTQVAQQFVDHRAELQFDLQVYASLGVAATNETLAVMSQNVSTVMEMVFELMRSPEERELVNFVSSRPGGADAILKNDTLLARVIAKQRPSRQDSLDGVARADQPLTIERLRQEVEKDVESVMKDNQFFDQKLEAMRIQIGEVKVTIQHETDRVLDAMHSGPHDLILDRDLFHIWKEMGWKGSVKAKHLVMAVRDHFAEESHAALAAIRDLTQDSDPDSAARMMSQVAEVARSVTPHDDSWALQYITVSRVQPLVEAIDSDVSSFVTVSEVNTFTSARPAGWSLPRWVAYWMFGFEMTMQWYQRRIRTLFSSIHVASRSVLLANSGALCFFLLSPQVAFAENLLSGVHTSDGRSGVDWDSDNFTVFTKFKDYIVDHENQLAERLHRLGYLVDEVNTLITLIVESERPESYVLPLVFLLLRRSLFIIQQASQVILHSDELVIILCSLQVIWEAVGDRVGTLRAMFKFQNLNKTEQLDNFSFGLYAHVSDKAKMGPLWERDPAMDAQLASTSQPRAGHQDSDTDIDLEPASFPLHYGPQVEELDVVLEERSKSDVMEDSGGSANFTENCEMLLVGHWAGFYVYKHDAGRDGLSSFTITAHTADGIIAGGGKDAMGPFSIRGSVINGGQLAFIKDYAMLQRGEKVVWYYEGRVQDDLLAIEGSWGLPESVMQSILDAQISGEPPLSDTLPPPGSKTDKLEVLGSFTFKRRPVEYFLACPPAEEFARNRPRALWKLAINVAMQTANAQSRRLDWGALRARRVLRERYVEITAKRLAYYTARLSAEETAEYDEMLVKIHPDDLYAWFALTLFRIRRQIVHRSCSCSVCRTVPIIGSRLVCADCTVEIDNTTEFCYGCFLNQGHARQPQHTLVQFRAPRMRIYLFLALSAAKRSLVYCSDHPPVGGTSPCAECQCAIRPAEAYWCCLDCEALSYVCAACNTRIEHERPWLRQRLPNADYARIHDWSHTLLLYHFDQFNRACDR